MNIICVARSMLIYKMLLQSLMSETIFEVWYSSCLSEHAVQDLKSALNALLSEPEPLDKNVKELLIHWKNVISSYGNLSIRKA